jgi:hypothetical protein
MPSDKAQKASPTRDPDNKTTRQQKPNRQLHLRAQAKLKSNNLTASTLWDVPQRSLTAAQTGSLRIRLAEGNASGSPGVAHLTEELTSCYEFVVRRVVR